MEQDKSFNKVVVIGSLICSLVLLGILGSYAYFIGVVGNNSNEEVSTKAGNLSLTFDDGNNGITEALEFGGSVEKTFSIKNTGTLDALVKINFVDLVNTFIEGSLTYSLSYRETEDEEYIDILDQKNVPRSESASIEELVKEIFIPAGKTYFYKLIITLNYLENIDQTSDLNAIFSCHFSLAEKMKANLQTSIRTLNIKTNENIATFDKSEPLLTFKDNSFETNLDGSGVRNPGNLYVTYSSSYTFNKETGKYSLLNPQVCKYIICFGTIRNKYVTSWAPYPTESIQPYTELTAIYKVDATSSSSLYKVFKSKESTLINTDESQTGVHIVHDEYGESYYYRGAVTNNYVKFGKWNEDIYRGYANATSLNYREYTTLEECQNATSYNANCTSLKGKDMYWRIIRINGNGSLRLIYDGTRTWENGSSSVDRIVKKNINYNRDNGNSSLGYMYGSIVADLESIQKNENDSLVKTALDSWYENNLHNTIYSKYISDEVFCNDRTIVTGEGINKETTLYQKRDTINNYQIDLACPKNDSFTVSPLRGNGTLKYPVGLITIDEAMLAGGKYNVDNPNFYLNKGLDYWTMSPIEYDLNAKVAFITSNGNLNYNRSVNSSFTLVPVINISPEFVLNMIGDGTMSNPYREKGLEP